MKEEDIDKYLRWRYSNCLTNICLIDSKLIWCSKTQKVITPATTHLAVLCHNNDNHINVYNSNHCEMEDNCYNFDCEYNHNQKHQDTPDKISQANIKHTQTSLNKYTEIIRKDEELLMKLNDPLTWAVKTVIDWEETE